MRWTPTVHAIQRLKERFGITPDAAVNYVNQIMAQAKYVSAGKADKLVYYYEKRDMMIVVNPDENVIVTVHEGSEPVYAKPAVKLTPTQSATITIDRIASAVKRELTRMTTQYRREIRKLSEQQAQLGVQVAELTLNKIRCYHPGTQALIQSRIDEAKARIVELANEIDGKLTQLQAAEQEVQAVIGE